ncbi:MAG: hypothetical protein KatS3mg109_1027 [Pirellulaceae bacterium]|nr:MAG: hypothetical protein KatS3mg109_1027 [Pirellulaceae bacterium]
MNDRQTMRCRKCGNELTVTLDQAGRDVECLHWHSCATVPSQLFGVAPQARTISGSKGASSGKSPATAAILNFLFWGAGYVYVGRGWGWAILIPYILLILVGLPTISEISGEDLLLSALLSLPIDIALGWHAYHMVKESQSDSCRDDSCTMPCTRTGIPLRSIPAGHGRVRLQRYG